MQHGKFIHKENSIATVRKIDRLMEWIIRLGGWSVIAAVLGLFLFIFIQVLPLFQPPQVDQIISIPTPTPPLASAWMNQSDALLLINQNGSFEKIPFPSGERTLVDPNILNQNESIQSAFYLESLDATLFVTSQNRFIWTTDLISMLSKSQETFADASGDVSSVDKFQLLQFHLIRIFNEPTPPHALVATSIANETELFLMPLNKLDGQTEIEATSLQRIGLVEWPLVTLQNVPMAVGSDGDWIVVGHQEQGLRIWSKTGDNGSFKEATMDPGNPISTHIRYTMVEGIPGEPAFLAVRPDGQVDYFGLMPAEDDSIPLWTRWTTWTLEGGSPLQMQVISETSMVSLLYQNRIEWRGLTDGKLVWKSGVLNPPAEVFVQAPFPHFGYMDDQHTIHMFEVKNRHLDVTFKSLFFPEPLPGHKEAIHNWQSATLTSTGPPSLSVLPLLVGSFKGSLYALLFAAPIALLGAVYTSQFAPGGIRKTVKSLMEIMASIPSVILGFIASTWLAPVLEYHLGFILVFIPTICGACMCASHFSIKFPLTTTKHQTRHGLEFFLLIPIVLAVGWISLMLGPKVSALIFVVEDPSTGLLISSFRLWLFHTFEIPYDQRNALLVGIILGVMVIPLIFSLCLEALEHIPSRLSAAAYSLGATRWQTFVHVGLPVAGSAIVAAILIGFGRALGETMIFLMATGNTPIMDMNLFTGMRSLTANLAIELPESALHGSLYRTLFFTAFLLLILSFAINTLAELVRQRLRRRALYA